MQIEVPLTLKLDVPNQEEADKYIDPATKTTNVEYLADLYDIDAFSDMLYEQDSQTTKVLSVNNLTQEDVRQILSAKIP